MKTKSTSFQKTEEDSRRKTKKGALRPMRPVCLHRRCPCEFSCGLKDPRARLVEESLDERERRG
jgi:hypothetical protein